MVTDCMPGRILAGAGRGKNVIQIVQARIDAGELIEGACGHGQHDRQQIFALEERLGRGPALQVNGSHDLA